MNVEEIRDFCLSLKGVTESFPFDETTLVFKVMGKIFCLMNLDGALSLNLKNRPEKNLEMREQFPCVQPGYHMNKVHWNTVWVDGSVSARQLMAWIRESYEVVVDGLPRKLQAEWRDITD